MTNKQLIEASKFLSYILRHEPQSIELKLDTNGWADVDLLITAASMQRHTLDKEVIREVVNSSDKKRFTLSDDGKKIRAAQGHSTPSVTLQHIEKEPPRLLYHGTATRFLESIFQRGLIAGSRHHVHLSQEIMTAVAVGRRHGVPVVLEIESLHMHTQGFKFFQSENDIWLTKKVPAELIRISAGWQFIG